MKEFILRGQPVLIDDSSKTIEFSIHKPMGNVFSISDRIFEYIKAGYKAKVILPTETLEISQEDKPFRKEEVKSKFRDSPSWYRYWYVCNKKKEEQITLANF